MFQSRLDRYSRRRFLGGTGAAVMVGLPLLETFTARSTRAQVGALPQRLLCIGCGNGMPMPDFTPNAPGANYTLPTLLSAFAPVRSKLNVITGLGIDEGQYPPGDHAAGMGMMYTCVTPNGPQDTNGISFDQVMAQALGSQTRIPSLQLGLREGPPNGDGEYGPVFLKNLSWASATQPLSSVVDPTVVFQQLFSGSSPQASSTENVRRLDRSISVLDYVAGESMHLLPALSTQDAQRLDQYFTATREVERQLVVSKSGGGVSTATCRAGVAPGSNLNYPDTMRAMSDLTVLALQCDATRIISLHLGCYLNDNYYGFLGVNADHHATSHGEPGYGIISRWLMDQVGYLFSKMNEVVEPDGTLLDNSIGIYNSDCGEADEHDHKNLPVLVLGGARGKIPTGRYYAFPPNTPCGGLYVTLLNALGVSAQTFGAKQSGPLALPA